MDNCFGCCIIGNKSPYWPNVKGQDKEIGQISGSNDAPKKNCFYALHSKGEQETSPDVVNGMLNV